MGVPRILIVDDQLAGTRRAGRNRLREDLCLTVGLHDVTGDAQPELVEEPIAEAVFHRGQAIEGEWAHNDPEGTLEAIRIGWSEWPRWALVLLDMQFIAGPVDEHGQPSGSPDASPPSQYFGLELLELLSHDSSLRDVPVVILSSMSRREIEARFASHGAYDFVDKADLTRDRLRELIAAYGLIESDHVIGRSVPLLRCLREARQRSRIGNDNILLIGETGTGKEMLARYIHNSSPRCDGPYVTVYTQGVPDSLIEDRLFGHEKGAFSGADAARAGAAEQANHGSLFIDEFGDVPALIQPKLLRLLDRSTRESQRIGASHDQVQSLDLQVILATNRLDMLELEGFRKDLLFRLRIADAVHIPPLRERREDVPLLTEYFVRKSERAFAPSIGPEHRVVSAEAIDLLSAHDWPDNVRGLEQVVESAVYRYPKLRVLSAAHVRLPLRGAGTTSVTGPVRPVPLAPTSRVESKDLDSLLLQLATLDLPDDVAARAKWAGKLPHLREAFARASASLLRAALVATLNPTPENPTGELRIHPAVKLATGDSNLSASSAADVIKRVMSIDPGVQDQLMDDPVLAAAYRKATRLRPKRRRSGASRR